MSTSFMITLAALVPAVYVCYRLLVDRPYYLLNARNKSSTGYVWWWLVKHASFLAVMCAVCLLIVFLFVRAEHSEWPIPLIACLAVGLLLMTMGFHDRLVKQVTRNHGSSPLLNQRLSQRIQELAPPAAPVWNSSLSQLMGAFRSDVRPRSGRRRRRT